MKYAIKILTDECAVIIGELKKQNTDRKNLLEKLKSTEKALKWLKMLDSNNAGNSDEFEFIRLPFMENCFESYHIMSDGESENVEYWTDMNLEVFPDDIILTRNKGVKK